MPSESGGGVLLEETFGWFGRRADERLDFSFRCVWIKIADDQGSKVGPVIVIPYDAPHAGMG